MTLFSVKAMILFSVILGFSLQQVADAISTEKLIHPDDLRSTHLVATHNDCSEQNKLRHFSLTRLQESIQSTPPPLKLNILRNLLLYLLVLKQKELKPFALLQPIKKLVNSVLKVRVTIETDMIVWIGILNLCLYRKNWTLVNVGNQSKTLMVRIALNKTNIITMAFSLLLIE